MSDRISYDKIRSAAYKAFREDRKRQLLLGEIEGWAEHLRTGGPPSTHQSSVRKEELERLLEHLKRDPQIMGRFGPWHLRDEELDRFAKELGLSE